MKVTVSIDINAPKEKVFEYFSDVQNLEKHIKGIKKVEILSDTTSGEGVKWRETRVMFGKEATEEMWITNFNPSTSYSVEAASHGMQYHTTYTFTENNGVTHVEMVFAGKPVSLGAKLSAPLFNLVFKGSTKKALRKDMQELKTLIESA